MPLDYILRRFSQRTGIQFDSGDQRKLALDYINEAARELYEALDIDFCMRECVLTVTSDVQISLPSFVGQVRGIREYSNQIEWKLSSLRPRYVQSNWSTNSIRTWREKAISPLYQIPTNIAPFTFSVSEVETADPVEVTITGETDNARNVSETIIMDETSKTGVVIFSEVKSIQKNRINTQNIIVTDADGNEIAVLYNDELESQYRIVDVSDYVNVPLESSSTYAMEILYKERLKNFYNDSDEFPVKGYDDVIVNKACQIQAEDTGNVKKAALYDAKAARTANRKSDNENRGKTVTVVPLEHPHRSLFRQTMNWARRKVY